MDKPATYYGPLDNRNPVLVGFKRDVKSFLALMKQVASSGNQDNKLRAKGITRLVELLRKYQHRLPAEFYQDYMLQISDSMFEMKLYQLALWNGYSLHLLSFSSVFITEISGVDDFMSSFFPEGLDPKQQSFEMKIRAMLGCALCIFEEEKKCITLSQNGLSKLLHVLNVIKIMLQAFQPYEHLCWLIYKCSSHIYDICRYLMTMKCSEQALEYLQWVNTSLESSILLMTSKTLPLIVSVCCAVCYCYYDNQAEAQAEEFATRALKKMKRLAEEEQSDAASDEDAQRTFKEAFLKLGALMFKRAVFDKGKRSQIKAGHKSACSRLPRGSRARSTTEHMLISQFDCSAAQFLGILETLWERNSHPLQIRMSDDRKQETVQELLSAGMSLLSGDSSKDVKTCDDHHRLSAVVLAPTSTLMEFALAGERKIPIMSAVRFIRLLFQYKQTETFNSYAPEMLRLLSGVEGQPFRKAERELSLLHSFNHLLLSEEDRCTKGKEENDESPGLSLISAELTELVWTLHQSMCGSDPEVQPDQDLVLDTVAFLWEKLKVFMLQDLEFTHNTQKTEDYDKWLWCLHALCEVGLGCQLDAADCTLVTKMVLVLGTQLEETAGSLSTTQDSGAGHVKQSSMLILKWSKAELLKMVCEVVQKGLAALATVASTDLPRDGSAVSGSAFTQKCTPLHPLSASATRSEDETADGDVSMKKNKERDKKGEWDVKVYEQIQPTSIKELYLELDIIYHKASLKLLLLNQVSESDLLDRIKKNRMSKAHLLIQKALLEHSIAEPQNSIKVKSLLKEASSLIEKIQREERKQHVTVLKTRADGKTGKVKGANPPPPPILILQTDHSLTFAPAPYNLEEQVSWYQLFGRVAEGHNWKVRLGDCSIPGTGNMVPVVSGGCVLRVEGLQANQRYVFAVAAYNAQAKLLGSTIGGTTSPVLASLPVPLLPAWAHLAQVAFQTEQYVIAKRACREVWSLYTDSGSNNTQSRYAATGLHQPTPQPSSPYLSQLFLNSVFIQTEISIQQGLVSLFRESGKFAWKQEATLAECERLLLALDLVMYLKDGRNALQAVVTCYRLLAPLIFNQITCNPVMDVLKKCLVVLEKNPSLLNQKWAGNQPEALQHMVACITYYLSKSFCVSKNHQMADTVMSYGCRILHEATHAHLKNSRSSTQVRRSAAHPVGKGQTMIIPQLKLLHKQNKGRMCSTDHKLLEPPDDPAVLYDLISSSTLETSYKHVMSVRHTPCFLEFAALLFQRCITEDHPHLVLQWGRKIFHILSRRCETLQQSTTEPEPEKESKSKRDDNPLTQNDTETSQSSLLRQGRIRMRIKKILPYSLYQCVGSYSELCMVDKLLNMMSDVVRRMKIRIQLRKMFSQESVWRSSINYSIAQAHLEPLNQTLNQIPEGHLQQRYSQIDPLWFSMAYSGTLMQGKARPQQSPQHKAAFSKDSLTGSVSTGDCVAEESCEARQSVFHTVEQQMETEIYPPASILDSVTKAAPHLRRAMVLAHRYNHWTTLQHICHNVWCHSCRIIAVAPSSNTASQLSSILTSLLVLAADLIMDMMNKLEIWSLYDQEMTEEGLEFSLHFSAHQDDSTMVDLHWVRSLVLLTLEMLHDGGKWESLAHLALLFNSYTRECYALTIAPLLVLAQTKLLERIISLGGPAVPQPHLVKTQTTTGHKVTCRSYASCQLLCGWTPESVQQEQCSRRSSKPNTTPRDADSLRGLEMKHSMLLVCIPLDVKDTVRCYHQALEKTPHCLQLLQQSRLSLMKLLAHTQPYFADPLLHCQVRSSRSSVGQVNFSSSDMSTTDIPPMDLCEKVFSTSDSTFKLPTSPEIFAAYTDSIKCLEAEGHISLTVQALHEKGNLQLYAGNICAAHSCWSKAIDFTFQSTGVVHRWDGVTFGCGSFQQTVELAGVWGCLQAAVLAAKIAQFIVITDIDQRTKCCLLSAHLFKCVLCCSLAHPQADLQYASYSIGGELFPGVDLFSKPHRLHLNTTVSSLSFISHWLFATGYYITLLPILAFSSHVVGDLCRNTQHTAEVKILKVRTLSELCLFSEAITEVVQLTQGKGILLPADQHIVKGKLQPVKTFSSNKPLLENLPALEDLVNCGFAADVCKLLGPTLCLRFNLAHIQLILALANTVGSCPLSGSAERKTSCLENSEHHQQDRVDSEDSSPQSEETKALTFCKEEINTPEAIRDFLLERASALLSSATQQLTSQCCNETERVELTVESNFLKANLYQQQGKTALSSKVAASSLKLLQTSTDIVKKADTEAKQDTRYQDSPRAVEAGERMGVSLWLRCRLTLVQSLVASIPDTAGYFSGLNINKATAETLQEGLDECVQWEECDIQAMLKMKGAELDAKRGKMDDSIVKLQGAVSLLSGRTCMPPGSIVTLAIAALSLSDLGGLHSTTLLNLTEKLLKKQLSDFGQNVAIDTKDSPHGSNNIYLPYFELLNRITLQIENENAKGTNVMKEKN